MGEDSLTSRGLALVVHRYVGLVMAVFLLVAGLTGTLLVFQEELDRLFAPELLVAEPPARGAPLLDPFELSERVQRQFPKMQGQVSFDGEPRRAAVFWNEVDSGRWQQVFVSPYTGQVQGARVWGELSEGWAGVMPFLYRFHYSLALGEVGTWLFGIVALLWVVDCFVGAYLTLPAVERRSAAKKASFWVRWLPAWLVRATRTFSLIFTWHRASGLWTWAMLMVFAWSAVGLNLYDFYRPVMSATLGWADQVHDRLPEYPAPYPAPQLTLREAHALGQRALQEEARRGGFHIVRERALYQAGEHGAFVYVVESSLDVSSTSASTSLYIDAESGRVLGLDVATGRALGSTVTSWINALHFASVGGLPYRLFVAGMGLFVALLSVTGVWIWWVKRAKRLRAPGAARATSLPTNPLGDSTNQLAS